MPHQNIPEAFSKLSLEDLRRYARRWMRKYQDAPISRIVLYRYSSPYQESLGGEIPTMYAVVFEAFQTPTTLYYEIETAQDSTYSPDELYNELHEKLQIATGQYQTITLNDRRYLRGLIDAGFKEVYKNPPDYDLRKDWFFILKRPDERLPVSILTNELYWVLYDSEEGLSPVSPHEKTGHGLSDDSHNPSIKGTTKKWFSGQELLERWNIADFELADFLETKALQAYTRFGKKVIDINSLEKKRKHSFEHFESLIRGAQNTQTIGKRWTDLRIRQVAQKEFEKQPLEIVSSPPDSAVMEFTIPLDEKRAIEVIKKIMGLQFKTIDVSEFEKKHNLVVFDEERDLLKIEHAEGIASKPFFTPKEDKTTKSKGRRKSTIDKEWCRAEAKNFQRENQGKSREEILEHIIKVAPKKMNRENYSQKKIEDWVRDLLPGYTVGQAGPKKKTPAR